MIRVKHGDSVLHAMSDVELAEKLREVADRAESASQTVGVTCAACGELVGAVAHIDDVRIVSEGHWRITHRRPWHDAKPGEAWVISLHGGDEQAVIVETFQPGSHVFQIPDGESVSITRESITSARRIWPEPDHTNGSTQ